MNIRSAFAAIQQAGIKARFVASQDPEMEDDEFVLNDNDNICVQISATRDGLRFSASFADGEGDDWGVTHGRMTKDPVAAAREAIALALA